MKKILLIISSLFFLIIPLFAEATFEPPFIVEELPMPEKTNFSGRQDEGIQVLAGGLMQVVKNIRIFAGILAVVWFVYLGFSMVSAGGDEEQVKKVKTGIIWAIISLCLILVSEPMIKNVFFGGGEMIAPGEVLLSTENITKSISSGKKQIIAILTWAKALLVTIAMVYLIFSGWRMIQSLGDEEVVNKQKTVVLWIAIGFVVIALNDIIINEVFYRIVTNSQGEIIFDDKEKISFYQDSVKGIKEFVGIVKFVLKFAAILAFAALVWGGGLFIFAFGQEEKVEKGKKIIFDAILGIIIILISFTLISTMISGNV